MNRRSISARVLAVALALLLAAGGAAWADQRDERLDGLFARLKATGDAAEAREVEGEIWHIWMTSRNEEVNRLMREGVGAMTIGDYPGALQRFNRMVELAPDFAEAWNKRATVLYLMGDFGGSLADIDRTLALEPRHFGALSGLGLIDTALEREEDALDAFERALAINPHMTGPKANAEELRRRIQERSI